MPRNWTIYQILKEIQKEERLGFFSRACAASLKAPRNYMDREVWEEMLRLEKGYYA